MAAGRPTRPCLSLGGFTTVSRRASRPLGTLVYRPEAGRPERRGFVLTMPSRGEPPMTVPPVVAGCVRLYFYMRQVGISGLDHSPTARAKGCRQLLAPTRLRAHEGLSQPLANKPSTIHPCRGVIGKHGTPTEGRGALAIPVNTIPLACRRGRHTTPAPTLWAGSGTLAHARALPPCPRESTAPPAATAALPSLTRGSAAGSEAHRSSSTGRAARPSLTRGAVRPGCANPPPRSREEGG